MEILIPILTLSSLGLVFGAGLALAAKKFCVKIDSRIEHIFACLPSANCGACGKAGCMGFAESLIAGEADINACVATAEENRTKISHILGIDLKQKIKTSAVLHCGGGKRVKNKFIYKGIETCVAANLVMAGHKECVYGCLGFGDCKEACPFGAIAMGGDELPKVGEAKCTACGKCVAVCPKKLFSLDPLDRPYYTNCVSLDFGKDVLSVCSVGCIACRKCEKACPHKAIEMRDNLAVFDYNKCGNAGECLKACPTKAILNRASARKITRLPAAGR